MTLVLPTLRRYKTASTQRLVDLVSSDSYVMQQKIDGVRFVLAKTEFGVMGYNKRYDGVEVPKYLYEACEQLPEHDWVFDGELCGDGYHIFDLVCTPGNRIEGMGFEERTMVLHALVYNWGHDRIKYVRTWYEPRGKFAALLRLRMLGAEGVVFRPTQTSPYYEGEIWKYKYYQTVDCIVTELNSRGKDAIEVSVLFGQTPDSLSLFDDNTINTSDLMPIGRVKVDRDMQEKLNVFDVVEVRHRGLSDDLSLGGRMVEPVFQRKRTDKPAYQCTDDQLTVRGKTMYRPAVEFDRIREAIGITPDEAIELMEGSHDDDD